MSRPRAVVVVVGIVCVAALAQAQLTEQSAPQDPPLANWTAPPYWTPPPVEHVRQHLGESSASERGVGSEGTPETTLAGPLPFFAVTPCRLVDTRTDGSGHYIDGETRVYDFSTNANCTGLPSTPQAWSLNVWIRAVSHQGYLSAWPDGMSQPLVATVVAYATGQFYSNAAVVPTGNGDKIDVYSQYAADVAIDVNGYYAATNIVNSVAGLTGVVGMTGGTGISLTTGSNTITITNTGVPGPTGPTGPTGGPLPSGTLGQTLYNNGSGWIASSVLTNDGVGAVGVSGVLNLPNTTSSTSGVITLGGQSFLHGYGSENTFVGQGAGNLSMSGSGEVGVGWQALAQNTSGGSNTAVGASALGSNTDGGGNAAFGWGAMASNKEGNNNTAVGAASLAHNDSGWMSTAVGSESLQMNTSGHANTATGADSLHSNTTGAANTASGNESLSNNTSASDNTATGFESLRANTAASKNTAIGSGALYTQSYDPGTGPWDSLNTAVGYQALYFNQPTDVSTGQSNTAVGAQSLYMNETGFANTASGAYSLFLNDSGNYGTAMGYSSLNHNQSGAGNTAIGAVSLAFNTVGSSNTACGSWSMYSNTEGSLNTAAGASSLYKNTTGLSNIGIGQNAGYNLTTGSYNIDIGNQGISGESNTIRIGDSNQTSTYIAGIYGVTIPGGSVVVVDSSGHLGVQPPPPATPQDNDATWPSVALRIGESPNAVLNELQEQRAVIQAQQAQIEALLARVAKLEAAAQP